MPASRSREPRTTVRDNAAASRYEIRRGRSLAGFSEYRDRGERRLFIHTEIDPDFANQGLATRLIADALDDVVARGKVVVARCPFVRAFLARHPDHPANRDTTTSGT